jgi:hypothetical protein
MRYRYAAAKRLLDESCCSTWDIACGAGQLTLTPFSACRLIPLSQGVAARIVGGWGGDQHHIPSLMTLTGIESQPKVHVMNV